VVHLPATYRNGSGRADAAHPDLLAGQGIAAKALLQSVMRLTPIAFWASSVPPDHLTLSKEAEELLGFAPGEFDGRFETWFARIHPEDQAKFRDAEAELRSGRRTFSYEYRFTTPAGLEKRLKSDGEAVLNELGELITLAGTVMEVPSLETQRGSVGSLEGHAPGEEAVPQFSWEQDRDCRFVSFSGGNQLPVPVLRNAVGLRRWELPNAVPLHSTWQEHIDLLRQHRPFRGFEYRFGSGAETSYLSSSGDPVFDGDGRFVGYRGTSVNITSRVLAQEEASQTAILLEHASRLGKLGGFALRVPEMEVTWSSGSRAIMGYAPAAQLSWRQAVSHLDEHGQHALERALQACVAGGAEFSIEAKATTAGGTRVFLRIGGEGERAFLGPVRRVIGSIQDISAQKEDERRVQELSERLTSTLESITEGFMTLDTQWRFTYVNRAAEEMSNRRREDLLGRVIWDVLPTFQGSEFHREYQRALTEGRSVRFEAYSERLSAWLEVYAYPSAQGLAVYFQDITEQKTAGDALMASEERHRMLFETALDATLQATADGRILAANPAACIMFRRTEEELRACGRRGVVAMDDPRLQPLLRELDATRRAFTQLTLLRGDGSRFEAEVSIARYGATDGNTYAVVVARDISERVRQQTQIRALNDNLAQLVGERTMELELANRELKGFARSLAHDLRQPIAAAKAFCNALTVSLSRANAAEARNYAGQVLSAVKTMGAYVEALLSLAQISQVSLEVEEVDLGAIADALLDQLQAQAPERKLLRKVQSEMYAHGDVTLLRMLLQNLLGNAWKFTARKDVTKISFTAQENAEGQLVYCIRDNGAGFDMARADKLFGTFQRLHDSSEFPGTGIGLANANRIVTRHGGLIWAESAPGAGAAFRFTLGQPTGPQSRLLPL
jgi:PAS domain S-box-containing protein